MNVTPAPDVMDEPSRDDIRVLVADRNRMLREALAELMQYLPGLRCVGEAESGEAAIELVQRMCPDAILVDGVLRDMDTKEFIRRARETYPSVRIIAYSVRPEQDVAEAFRAAGADAFVDKASGVEDLVATIHRLGLVPEPMRSDCDGRRVA